MKRNSQFVEDASRVKLSRNPTLAFQEHSSHSHDPCHVERHADAVVVPPQQDAIATIALLYTSAIMVVVRESPRAKVSPDKNTAQWPPKSPFQALLSSPSGRKKWKEYSERRSDERSPSPSPMKKTVRDAAALQAMSVASSEEDPDEDEETLQLQLMEIQAKLKLKKLQKQGKSTSASEEKENARSRSRSPEKQQARPSAHSPEPSRKVERAFMKPRGLAPSAMESGIEVPLSPAKERSEPQEQMSPARRRLGLSAATKASDVSLKRARDGTQLSRDHSGRDRRRDEEPAKPKMSFSERLKQSKTESLDREARQERIERTRSTGFASSNATPNGASRASTVRERPRPKNDLSAKRPSSAHGTQAPSGPDVLAGIARSCSTRTARPAQSATTREANVPLNARSQSRTDSGQAEEEPSEGSPGFDPFSQIHLSKRHIPHVDIARAMEDKEIYTLPRLLKEVKAPHYDPPDCEGDFVVFAVVASKSSPFDQKATHRTNDENKPQEDAEKPRNKFMVVHLTDLKWELDMFLFGSGFDQFWKLTPGTLLAILNPGIMPPKGNQNTGRFSLKLGSSEDCVMEVGVARDLGYCSSVKKDGNQCGAWVDKRSTEICEFHLNLMIDRERKHRMEVNSMFRGQSGAGQGRKFNSRSGAEGSFDKFMEKDKKGPNSQYSREYGQLYSVRGGSTANLLDAEDKVGLDEEASRKRIAAAQIERDLARKLGAMGDSVGSEYMRTKEDSTVNGSNPKRGGTDASQTPYFDKPSISSLGLLGKKASDQHLSPAKDRKRHFGLGAVGSAGTEAMGWGGARKAGLLQAKQDRLGSPEKGQAKLSGAGRPGIVRNRSEEGSLSPKKRARFALSGKGIREPGRESGGEELRRLAANAVDEEELDIV